MGTLLFLPLVPNIFVCFSIGSWLGVNAQGCLRCLNGRCGLKPANYGSIRARAHTRKGLVKEGGGWESGRGKSYCDWNRRETEVVAGMQEKPGFPFTTSSRFQNLPTIPLYFAILCISPEVSALNSVFLAERLKGSSSAQFPSGPPLSTIDVLVSAKKATDWEDGV